MARKQAASQDIPAGWEVVGAPTPAPAAAAPVAAAPLPTAPATPAGDLPEGFESVTTVDVEGGRYPLPTEPGYKEFVDAGYQLDENGIIIPDQAPPEGLYADPTTGEQALHVNVTAEAEPEPAPPAQQVSAEGARMAGLKSGALNGWDDEISGIGGAVGNWLGRNAPWTAPIAGALTGRGLDVEFDKGSGDFWKDYEEERAGRDQYKNDAWQQRPGQYSIGYVPGMITNLALPGGRAVQGENALANGARLSGVGGAYAAINGAGNATPGERIPGAMRAAPVGMVLGPTAPLITRGVGAVGTKIAEATGIGNMLNPRNALNSGLDVLSRRMGRGDIEAMPGRVDDWRTAGVEPRLVDVMGEQGRGAVRSVVTRSRDARTEAAEAANAVYTDVQDRVADTARRVITPDVDPRLTSRRLAREIEGERNALAGPEFDAVRNQTVPVTPQIAEVLNTPEGMRALTAARALMQPAEREQVNAVIAAVRRGNIGGEMNPEAQRLIDQLPSGLSPAARESAVQQITAQFPPPPTAEMTVDIADKLSRSLLGRANANTTPGLARVSRDMGNAVRDSARTAVPGYGTALDAYAARSGVAEAAGRTGRFEDARFTSAPADVYADTVGTASRQPVDFAGQPVSQRDALRVGAREEIADKASTSPANAYSTARGIRDNSAQMDRSRALLGDRGAIQLREGMGREADRVANTRYIDERIGSKTSGMLGDQGMDELIQLVPNAMSGGKWAIVRGVADFTRRMGVRGVDAERLVRDAISDNPTRVDQAVQYLVGKNMDRAQARTVVRSIIASMAGRAPQATNIPPPNTAPPAPDDQPAAPR